MVERLRQLVRDGPSGLEIRIDRVNDHDNCRIDMPSSSRPIWVKNKKGADALYQHRNNSPREVPSADIGAFIDEGYGRKEPLVPV